MKFITCFLTLLSLIVTGLALPAAATAADKRVIIGFRQAPGTVEAAAVSSRGGKINRKFKHLRAMTASLPEEEIAKLKNNPLVAYIQEDVLIQMIDPLPAEYLESWGVSRIGSAVAHDASILGTGVKIAILDTGIDYSHPELSPVFQSGISFVQDENGVVSNPDPMDDSSSGHGTHVAGIIAAAMDGTGTVGVAPQAQIYAVKVLDGAGFGTIGWVLSGIDWAIEQQVNIINMSLALSADSPGLPALEEACQTAWDAGILLVAAAGNTGGGAVTFPAGYDTVIAVGATDSCDSKSTFSAIGPEVELTAPGTAIPSTLPGGGYGPISGTSQAAPHVAGAAALVISAGMADLNSNGFINDEIRQKLRETAQDLGIAGQDTSFGYGLVDAAGAVGMENIPPTNNCSGPVDPGPIDPVGVIPVGDIFVSRQSRHSDDDAQQATLSGGKYAITILNNGLRKLTVEVYKANTFVPELSGTLAFNRKTVRGVTLNFDATTGPYQVVFTPTGRFGSSATLLFNAPVEKVPTVVKGINRKHKHLVQ